MSEFLNKFFGGSLGSSNKRLLSTSDTFIWDDITMSKIKNESLLPGDSLKDVINNIPFPDPNISFNAVRAGADQAEVTISFGPFNPNPRPFWQKPTYEIFVDGSARKQITAYDIGTNSNGNPGGEPGSGRGVVVSRPGGNATLQGNVDIFFLIDRSGSMSAEALNIKNNINDLVKQVETLNPRIGAGSFLGPGETVVLQDLTQENVGPPSSPTADALSNFSVSGGTESSVPAIDDIIGGNNCGSSSVNVSWVESHFKFIVLVTDEPAFDDFGNTSTCYQDLVNDLLNRNFIIIGIGKTEPDWAASSQGNTFVTQTGGKHINIDSTKFKEQLAVTVGNAIKSYAEVRVRATQVISNKGNLFNPPQPSYDETKLVSL